MLSVEFCSLFKDSSCTDNLKGTGAVERALVKTVNAGLIFFKYKLPLIFSQAFEVLLQPTVKAYQFTF
jgi:hypothetical protein